MYWTVDQAASQMNTVDSQNRTTRTQTKTKVRDSGSLSKQSKSRLAQWKQKQPMLRGGLKSEYHADDHFKQGDRE